MKKNIILNFTRILFGLFIVGTIITLFIVYKDTDNIFSIKFVKGYLILTIFFIFYVPIITILNLNKLKWNEIKKRIINFIGTVVLITCVNCSFDYFFKSSKIDIFRAFTDSLGLAFGINFIDIIIFKIRDKSNDTA